MTSMDDLIATISGSMHVSQDGYDLKALQAHLAQTLFVPTLSLSPNPTYHQIPSSRSTSRTRKSTSLNSANNPSFPYSIEAPFPSPIAGSVYGNPSDGAEGMTYQRPSGVMNRRSSYGFTVGMAGPSNGPGMNPPQSPPTSLGGFESDAFAPLWQGDNGNGNGNGRNPWGNGYQVFDTQSQQVSTNIWGTGFRQAQGFGQSHIGMGTPSIPPQMLGRPPTPPDESDECMDEDMVDSGMGEYVDEDDDDENEERAVNQGMGLGVDLRSNTTFGFGFSGIIEAGDGGVAGQGQGQNELDPWGRGRWKS